MAEDDDARADRAERLRQQISRLKKQEEEGEGSSPHAEHEQPDDRTGKSPRDFINERMRELDGENKEGSEH